MQVFIYRKIRLLVQLHIHHIKMVLQQTKAKQQLQQEWKQKKAKQKSDKFLVEITLIWVVKVVRS